MSVESVAMSDYVLVGNGTGESAVSFPLVYGRNTVGRSNTISTDPAFISLSSDRGAISRLHAAILVAPNGDVWLSDLRSTNGTVVARNSGDGVRAEPEHWYQVLPGTRVVFGDVEMLVQSTARAQHAILSPTGALNGASTAAGSSAAATAPISGGRGGPAAQQPIDPASIAHRLDQLGGHGDSRPYLDDDDDEDGEAKTRDRRNVPCAASRIRTKEAREAAAAAARGMKRPPQPAAHGGASDDEEDDDGDDERLQRQQKQQTGQKPPQAKKGAKVDPAALAMAAASVPTAGAFRACMTGLDSAERARLQKVLCTRGSTVVDEIGHADLLIVKTPAARTPKFLIAVGCGIPIVTADFVDGAVPRARAGEFTPALEHGDRTYKPQLLRSSIASNAVAGPVLRDRIFYIGAVPAKQRAVVADIITGCGGLVAKRKTDADAIALDSSPDGLYDAILSGTVEAYVEKLAREA